MGDSTNVPYYLSSSGSMEYNPNGPSHANMAVAPPKQPHLNFMARPSTQAAPQQQQQQQQMGASAEHENTKIASPEEEAASALMLAAFGRPKAEVKQETMQQDQGSVAPENTQDTLDSDSQREHNDVSVETADEKPNTKRKKHRDFLRRNRSESTEHVSAVKPTTTSVMRTTASLDAETSDIRQQESQPCHISPVSSSSVGSHATEQQSPISQKDHSEDVRGPATHAAGGSAQHLLEAAKIQDTRDIALSSSLPIPTWKQQQQQQQPSFPILLHKVLSESQFAGSVLEWLPHGQSWRVLRWDEMHRTVLPMFFPHIMKANDKSIVDSFLWQVKAWGFQEVKDSGLDMGSYRHTLFLRGLPKLCDQMHVSLSSTSESEEGTADGESKSAILSIFKPRAGELQKTNNGAKVDTQQPFAVSSSPGTKRKLGSRDESEDARGDKDDEEEAAARRSRFASGEGRNESMTSPSMSQCHNGGADPQWHPRRDIAQRYVARAPSTTSHNMSFGYNMGEHPFPDRRNQFAQFHPSNERPGAFRQSPLASPMAPPRLRSGRGGLRGSPLSKRAVALREQQESTKQVESASSFPVSQRGKGVIRSNVQAVSAPQAQGDKTGAVDMLGDKEATFGRHMQESVAVAVSKKSKRAQV
eukprot:scaffold26027_cov70-Attheya_sp.AAC.2